jgi:hypothetical protein
MTVPKGNFCTDLVPDTASLREQLNLAIWDGLSTYRQEK